MPSPPHSQPPTPPHRHLTHISNPIRSLSLSALSDYDDRTSSGHKRRVSDTESIADGNTTPKRQCLDLSETATASVSGYKRGSRARGSKAAKAGGDTLASLRVQVAEMKKAAKTHTQVELARNESYQQSLQREVETRTLLSTKEKHIADLLHQSHAHTAAYKELEAHSSTLDDQCKALEAARAQFVAKIELLERELESTTKEYTTSRDQVTQLQDRLRTLEETYADACEAADVSYKELKERSELELEELHQALNAAREALSGDNTQDLQDELTVLQRKVEKYQVLEEAVALEGNQREVERKQYEAKHEELIDGLRNQLQSLETAYERLGQDSRRQAAQLKDDYDHQLRALKQQHGAAVQELKDSLTKANSDHAQDLQSIQRRYEQSSQEQQELQTRYDNLENEVRQQQQEGGQAEAKLADLRGKLEESEKHRREDTTAAAQRYQELEARHQENLAEANQQLQWQEGLQQQIADSNSRVRQLENAQQLSVSTDVMEKAIADAITDANKEAERQFNAWKAAYESGLQACCFLCTPPRKLTVTQVENNNLRVQLDRLRTQVPAPQVGFVIRILSYTLL